MSVGKLYYTPTSCGAASYIVALAAGVKVDSEKVDIKAHKTAGGEDYYKINFKGNVPTLVLNDGTVLNEGPSVCQYLADQNPQSGLLAPVGNSARYETIGDFNWVGTELHKTVGNLFNPTIEAPVREFVVKNSNAKLDFLESKLLNHGGKYIRGDKLTIADVYLYIVLTWLPYIGLSIENRPNTLKFFNGIKDSEVVQRANSEMNQ
ncbi:glutathione S-transferase [Acrasis kona]|uniref:Glutathione S-transferase n=1 Tax=Acrasis kona TaxID=1008807 RepID=A0AAW2ZAR9_9EUKA